MFRKNSQGRSAPKRYHGPRSDSVTLCLRYPAAPCHAGFFCTALQPRRPANYARYLDWNLSQHYSRARCALKTASENRNSKAQCAKAVVLCSSAATRPAPFSGGNPKGRQLFSCISALLVAYLAELNHAPRALNCTKIAAGAHANNVEISSIIP